MPTALQKSVKLSSTYLVEYNLACGVSDLDTLYVIYQYTSTPPPTNLMLAVQLWSAKDISTSSKIKKRTNFCMNWKNGPSFL